MSDFIKVLISGAIVIAFIYGFTKMLELRPPGYWPSNQIIYPYDISRNPYKYKGKSGILDTLDVPLLFAMGGKRVATPYPGGSLEFENMIDEHTAVFGVRAAGQFGVEGSNKIAVELENSDPPEPIRPWRVYVEGSRDVETEDGETVTIGVVRFEGYAPLPDRPPPVRAPAPSSSPTNKGSDTTSASDGTQPPAPIERRLPALTR